MLVVRQCMIGETAWFRKLEGEYHYMGESHGAGDVVRLVFEEDWQPVAMMVARSLGMWICARHPDRTVSEVRRDLFLHPSKLFRVMTRGGLQ